MILASLAALSVYLYLIMFFPIVVRKYRLKSLANKFGLDFDGERSSFARDSNWPGGYRAHYRKNVLKGSINGHTVEIYDYWDLKQVGIFPPPYDRPYYEGKTVYVIDGVARDSVPYGDSVGKIRNELSRLL